MAVILIISIVIIAAIINIYESDSIGLRRGYADDKSHRRKHSDPYNIYSYSPASKQVGDKPPIGGRVEQIMSRKARL